MMRKWPRMNWTSVTMKRNRSGEDRWALGRENARHQELDLKAVIERDDQIVRPITNRKVPA